MDKKKWIILGVTIAVVVFLVLPLVIGLAGGELPRR